MTQTRTTIMPGVNTQLYYRTPGPPALPSMKGFIRDYYEQRRDVNHSHKIMYYFTPDKLPVLTGLARNYAVFNGWFASIPGPTICNRAFSHYGTSFGQVGLNIFYWKGPYLSIYERMLNAGRTARIYYYDEPSSTTGDRQPVEEPAQDICDIRPVPERLQSGRAAGLLLHRT